MVLKHVMAIVRTDVLEDVECRLRHIGVPGVTVARVKGFGEYANFFTPDWMSAHARIEVFTDAVHAERIVDAIMQAAHTGTAGDGIVSVLPVERIFRIRDRHEMDSPHARDASEAKTSDGSHT